ncbi:hypothetical protein [Vibrio phage V-YDF132]|nr:hypothetical protein [Vibrio phage V-YDF132]
MKSENSIEGSQYTKCTVYALEFTNGAKTVGIWDGEAFNIVADEEPYSPDEFRKVVPILSQENLEDSLKGDIDLAEYGKVGVFATCNSMDDLISAASRYSGSEGTVAMTYAMMGYNTALQFLKEAQLLKPYFKEKTDGSK